MDEEQVAFQEEFSRRLQQQMGKLLFDNMGQQLRMETMAREAAMLQLKVDQMTPKPLEGDVK